MTTVLNAAKQVKESRAARREESGTMTTRFAASLWLTAAAAFLAMAHAFKHGDFVRVTLLLEKVSAPVRRVLEIVSLVIACFAVGYLAFWATRFTWESYEFNDMAGGMLAIAIWIPQTTFVAGSWLLFIAVLDEMVLVARGARPTYVTAVEERHAHGDFSSDI